MIEILNNGINNLSNFIFDNGVLTFIMGTMIGFSVTNLIKSFKVNMIDFFINKYIGFNTESHLLLLLSSIFEFIFILLLIYLLYTKVFSKIIQNNKNAKNKENEWRQNVIITLNKIADKPN
jgi:hypothetical protein